MKRRAFLSSRSVLVFNLVLFGTIFGFSLAFLSFSCSSPTSRKTAWAESGPQMEIPANSFAVAESVQDVFNSVAKRTLQSVVEIKVVQLKTQQVPRFNGIPWEFFFGPKGEEGAEPEEREYRSQGLGSGIIIRRSGDTHYILTNNHVIEDANEISVVVNDGREFVAKLVGKDPRKDLALVSFESSEAFPLASLGDSDSVEVGDWAIAVGNPLGLVSSVTMGIISAVGRTGGPAGNINDFIQTDAAINQGNSGGALVNIRGEVIGINTWIASNTGGSVGLGFAIPVNNAKRAIEDFIETGTVRYGWLGVSLMDADKDLASDLSLEGKKGAFVSQLFIGSPAQKGGIQAGDFITAINGKPVRDRSQLVLMVGDLQAGEVVPFTLIRDGKTLELKVKIDERTDEIAADNNKLWPGLVPVPLSDEVRKALKLDAGIKGLYVADVIARTPAAAMGLQRGDIITALNGDKIENLRAFYRLLAAKSSGELWFEVRRGENTLETMRYKR